MKTGNIICHANNYNNNTGIQNTYYGPKISFRNCSTTTKIALAVGVIILGIGISFASMALTTYKFSFILITIGTCFLSSALFKCTFINKNITSSNTSKNVIKSRISSDKKIETSTSVKVNDSGIKHVDLNSEDIKSITLDSIGDLTITQGNSNTLTIEADNAILDKLTYNVTQGNLNLGTVKNSIIIAKKRITYTLTTPHPNNVFLYGQGNIVIKNLDLKKFNCEILGQGNIDVEGEVNNLVVNITGQGTCNAQTLLANIARVSISGQGNSHLNVTEKLYFNISGQGKCTYIGGCPILESFSMP